MKQIALVTGASRGIGRAIARELSCAGYAVCVNYLEQAEQAEQVVRELSAQGRPAAAIQADVADAAAVREMVQRIKALWGPVTLLVNNAGISRQGLFQDAGDDVWQRSFDVNVNGCRNTIQAVLPDMIHEKAGCIVNVSSIWGLRGASCEVPYACTKSAIVGLTRSLALELAPSHIRVNAVAPGCIETDMVRMLGQETIRQLIDETPLGRLGQPEDIANAVAFLASDKASFITGQILTVDGGFIG